MKLNCLAAIAIFLAVATVPAIAQSNYPERSVRVIYGFAAGADVVVRLLADKLADVLGKPVIVDNVAGAAGNIGATDRQVRPGRLHDRHASKHQHRDQRQPLQQAVVRSNEGASVYSGKFVSIIRDVASMAKSP